MVDFDVARFETKMTLRRARPEHIPAIIELQHLCFPGMVAWTPAQLEKHQRIFPEGQLVVEVDGKVVASSSSLILEFEEYDNQHSFNEITENGSIENHDPEGSNLYGIEVMVHPDYRAMKLGARLYDARKELCERLDLESIIIAGRMPGYREHAEEMKPGEYVRAVLENRLSDPVLSFQINNGFKVRRVIEDYLPRDGESQGFAVLMEWHNIEYRPRSRRRMKTSQPVRICVIQYQMRKIHGFEEFASQCEYFADVAANYKSDFAVFPELLTTQLLSTFEDKRPWEAARLLTSYTEKYLELFHDLAVNYNVNIIGGTHFIQEDDKLYNVAFLFRRNGTIERQYKIHVTPNEAKWWGTSAGDDIRVFDTDVGKIGIQVCYDAEFPEMSRIQTDLGANIIFVPFCTEDRQGYLRVRYCAQARAIENQIYTVIAGTVGNLPDSDNMDVQYAQSGIFTPSDFSFPRDGIAGECTPNVETVIVGDIDLEALRRTRRNGTVMQLRDRRLDLYHIGQTEPAADKSIPAKPVRHA